MPVNRAEKETKLRVIQWLAAAIAVAALTSIMGCSDLSPSSVGPKLDKSVHSDEQGGISSTAVDIRSPKKAKRAGSSNSTLPNPEESDLKLLNCPLGELDVDQEHEFVAEGGKKRLEWVAVGGDPPDQNGKKRTFTTKFDTPGPHSVRVSDKTGQGPGCLFNVIGPVTGLEILGCPESPILPGDLFELELLGGAPPYIWESPLCTCNTKTPEKNILQGYYGGFFAPKATITATDGIGQEVTCEITLKEPFFLAILNCPTEPISVGQEWFLTASAATAPYSWKTPGASSETGRFITHVFTYNTPGTFLATLTDGDGLQETCEIEVSP